MALGRQSDRSSSGAMTNGRVREKPAEKTGVKGFS
jgi:hypothetical protein